MSSAHRRTSIRLRGAAVLAFALMGIVVGAGNSGAAGVAVTEVGQFGTDCSYRLSLPVPATEPVVFVESDVDGGRAIEVAAPAAPTRGVASVTWTPTVRGDRILVARQGDLATAPMPVSVRAGGGRLCDSASA